MGSGVRGYRRPFGQDGAPDVTNVETDVLRNCLVLENFDGFSYSSGVPPIDTGDEFCLLPLDEMICFVRVFDD